MASYDILEAEIDEIKKQLSYIKKFIEGGSESGNTGSETSPSDDGEWTTLYDCSSDDATINLGYTSGIKGATSEIASFPDLMPYSKLRVFFKASTDFKLQDYDITDMTTNAYYIVTPSRTISSFYGFCFILTVNDNGKRVIRFGNCTQIDFYTNKYTALTNLKTSQYFYIMKIQAK